MPPPPRGKPAERDSILHDLGAPLTAARVWAELLCQAKLRGRAAKWAAQLHDCLAEIGHLLVVSTPSEVFAPVEEAESVARMLGQRGSETGTRFLCSGLGRGPWVVRGGKVAFRRIATNLLCNVLRHAPGGCVEVEVSLKRAPGGWKLRLEVGDEGPGLGRRAAALFRAGGRGRDSAGRGLGLHNVRELARANGGEAGARDEAEGARFWAEMAVSAEPGAEPEPARGGPVILTGGPLRQRRWLARLLTGWRIACAEVPADATAAALARANRQLGGGALVLAEGARPAGWETAGLAGWNDLARLGPCGPGGLREILDGAGSGDRLAKRRRPSSMQGVDAQDQGQAPA